MTEEDLKAAEAWYKQHAGERREARQTPKHLRECADRFRAQALCLETKAIGLRMKADRLDKRADSMPPSGGVEPK